MGRLNHPSLPRLATRVYVHGGEQNSPVMTGTIVGHGHAVAPVFPSDDGVHRTEMQPRVLVQLDEGFYSPDGHTYIAELSVHPDNIAVLHRTELNTPEEAFI